MMTDKEYYGKLYKNSWNAILRLFAALAAIVIILLMCSCKSQSSVTESSNNIEVKDSIRYIDVVRDSINSIMVKNIKDSIRIKDSTVIVVDSAGRELKRNEWHSEYIYRYDGDSTAYYKNVAKQALLEMEKKKNETREVLIEKSLTGWEKLKVDYGGYAFAACIILVIVLYLLLKIKKHTI